MALNIDVSYNSNVINKILPMDFYNYLNKDYDIDFFCGVPDSLLQDLNNCILEKSLNNHIVPNEGLALSMACGYYVSNINNKIPCIYLQNSGIGNLINPLLSLAHKNVYSIPSLIIIGWRGEPNVPDEPQDVTQGECMLDLIQSMNFEYVVIDNLNWKLNIDECIDKIRKNNFPVFLVIKKYTFEKYSIPIMLNEYSLIRRSVIEKITLSVGDNDIICCTTGKSSRELDEITTQHNINKSKTFLMVGAMGHLSSFCLGLSLNLDNSKRVYCIDGDGAMLMHFGMLPYIGFIKPKQLIHILLNNAMHESVGVQPTISQNINYEIIAKELGYEHVFVIKTKDELIGVLQNVKKINGLIFIHILLSNQPSNNDLLRPKIPAKERIEKLMGLFRPLKI
jgi:phosphonopyruvate decarboxylase